MIKEDDFTIENTIFDWKFYLVNSSELNEKKIRKKDDVVEYFKKNDITLMTKEELTNGIKFQEFVKRLTLKRGKE